MSEFRDILQMKFEEIREAIENLSLDQIDDFDQIRDLREDLDQIAGELGTDISGLEYEAEMGHFISEDEFPAYARELADDLGVDVHAWPATSIDWEQAADDLRGDFCSVEVDGQYFYYRG